MKFYVLLIAVCSLMFFSCGNEVKEEEPSTTDSLSVDVESFNGQAKLFEPKQDKEVEVLEKKGIILREIKTENNHKASLTLTTTSFKEGVNELDFDVEGEETYAIAMIANNYEVTHYKEHTIKKEFMFGNNVFLAFLTHKNGVAVKTNKAFVLKNVVIDDDNLFSMEQPHLFYYLPKAITQNPVLDFCLVNTTIAKNANKVKATCDGVVFIIKKWAAYQIEGLQKGNHTIRIQLIDKDGNLISGPFNDSGERDFVVR